MSIKNDPTIQDALKKIRRFLTERRRIQAAIRAEIAHLEIMRSDPSCTEGDRLAIDKAIDEYAPLASEGSQGS